MWMLTWEMNWPSYLMLALIWYSEPFSKYYAIVFMSVMKGWELYLQFLRLSVSSVSRAPLITPPTRLSTS